jgi:hypothetical protein
MNLVHACDSSTQETEAGKSEASLGYIARQNKLIGNLLIVITALNIISEGIKRTG